MSGSGSTPVVRAFVSRLDRGSPTPLFKQLALKLREQIESGGLAPLARIPSEVELAASSGVSRMTARRAIDDLEDEGYLVRRPRAGTFVAPARITHPLSTSVSLSAAITTLGLSVSTRVLVAALMPAPPTVAHELHVRAGEPVVAIHRVRSVEGEPYAMHETYLPRRFAAVLSHDMEGSMTEAMRQEGFAGGTSHDSLEAKTASGDEADALSVRPGSAVLRVEGRAHGPDGAPTRYTRSTYRGDRFSFSVATTVLGALRLTPAGTGAPEPPDRHAHGT